MENVTRVGIDLGKQVFHVTAVDAAGAVVERKRLRPCWAAVVSEAATAWLRGGDGELRRRAPLGAAGAVARA